MGIKVTTKGTTANQEWLPLGNETEPAAWEEGYWSSCSAF